MLAQVLARRGRDGGHLRLVQQRARRAAHRAARRPADRASSSSRWAPAHIGDIARARARSRRPTCPLVLNVGKAHLGEFGSREAIAQAKGEIVEALGADGVAVLNADDPLVAAMAARTAGPGAAPSARAPDADVRLAGVGSTTSAGRRSSCWYGGAGPPVALGLVGEHHAANAAAAAAVALAARGAPGRRRGRALGAATATSPRRMEVARARRRA